MMHHHLRSQEVQHIMDMEDIMRNEHNSRETDSEILYFTTILDDMWRGFKKFFLLCLIIIAACGAGFYFRAKTSYKPSYQAYSSFVVDTKTAYVYNQDYSNEKTAGQLSKTFPYILTSGALSDLWQKVWMWILFLQRSLLKQSRILLFSPLM